MKCQALTLLPIFQVNRLFFRVREYLNQSSLNASIQNPPTFFNGNFYLLYLLQRTYTAYLQHCCMTVKKIYGITKSFRVGNFVVVFFESLCHQLVCKSLHFYEILENQFKVKCL